ncbi:Alanine aminotransferase [Mycena kentingensis (nom. inval.)]|nr:Alanine aminotransferase [Mycena kentingensis (nom. inval.)]
MRPRTTPASSLLHPLLDREFRKIRPSSFSPRSYHSRAAIAAASPPSRSRSRPRTSASHNMQGAEDGLKESGGIRHAERVAFQGSGGLRADADALLFDKVISSNIGNPQQKGLDQPPITCTRQIATLSGWPAFPELAGRVPCGSRCVPFIRKNVAKFISDRDGFPDDSENIFLINTAGASAGVSLPLTKPSDGILIPIPQYSLYTAALVQHRAIPYLLDESSGSSTSVASVAQGLAEARAEGTSAKAVVNINPGIPTGTLLACDTMAELVKLCEEQLLVLLADEVYRNNLHPYKLASVGLCPPLAGQIGVDSMVCPPKEGEPSYARSKKETDTIHAALALRMQLMATRPNALLGVSCVQSPSALYLFPRIDMPEKAARDAGQEPDAFYTLALLDETGI